MPRSTYHVALPVIGTLSALFLFTHTYILAGILATLSVIAFYKSHTHERSLLLGALVVGAIFEVAFVNMGVWTYHYADVAHIPLWIPFVWVLGTWFVMTAPRHFR